MTAIAAIESQRRATPGLNRTRLSLGEDTGLWVCVLRFDSWHAALTRDTPLRLMPCFHANRAGRARTLRFDMERSTLKVDRSTQDSSVLLDRADPHRRFAACAQRTIVDRSGDDDHVAGREERDVAGGGIECDAPAPRFAAMRRELDVCALTRR